MEKPKQQPIELVKNMESISSSATITPTAKTFPTHQVDENSSSTPTPTSTKTNRNVDQLPTAAQITPKSSVSSKKQSSFSFISQLSDEIFGDVASKAKSTIPTLVAANRRLSHILKEQQQQQQTESKTTEKQDCKK